MKLTLEFNLPEDKYEADRVQYAGVAWQAISDAIHIIRSHTKYDVGTAEETITQVNGILWEAQGKLHE